MYLSIHPMYVRRSIHAFIYICACGTLWLTSAESCLCAVQWSWNAVSYVPYNSNSSGICEVYWWPIGLLQRERSLHTRSGPHWGVPVHQLLGSDWNPPLSVYHPHLCSNRHGNTADLAAEECSKGWCHTFDGTCYTPWPAWVIATFLACTSMIE